MKTSSLPQVTDADGVAGRLDVRPQADAAQVHLGDGTVVQVSRDRLVPSEDGDYRADVVFAQLPAAERATGESAADSATVVDEATLPLIEEVVQVRTRKRDTGRVRVTKRVEEHTETVDEPLVRETVEVERVPIDRVLDAAPAIREDGDTTVIPVVEERLVVRKEIVLVEELHVTRIRTEHRDPQYVTLRCEVADVERTGPEPDDAPD